MSILYYYFYIKATCLKIKIQLVTLKETHSQSHWKFIVISSVELAISTLLMSYIQLFFYKYIFHLFRFMVFHIKHK